MKKKQQNQKFRHKKPRAGLRDRRQLAVVQVTGISRENPRMQGWKRRVEGGQSARALNATLGCLGVSLFIVAEES